MSIKNHNPLFQSGNLPEFDQMAPQHLVAVIETIIKSNRLEIKKLLIQKKYSWHNFVAPLEAMQDKLSQPWALLAHLNATNGTKVMRRSYQKALPLVANYFTQTIQNKKIYEAFRCLKADNKYHLFDEAQKKIISNYLRDSKLAGTTLSAQHKKQFLALTQKLAKLGHRFSCNVLDATQKCEIRLRQRDTKGLPPHILSLGKNNASKNDFKGWIFNLDYPTYHALVTYAESRRVRKKAYTAYVTRATANNLEHPQFSNDKIIINILKTRAKLAKLLNFKNYVEYSLATKMAENSEQVLSLLHALAEKAMPRAKQELDALRNFARNHGIKKLAPWDINYYEEKLSQKKHALDQEKLRAYFPLDIVLQGIFTIAHTLYGVATKERSDVSVPIEGVRFFEIYDARHQLLGQFYLDAYAKENKYGGAWMSDYRPRHLLKNHRLQLPLVFLVTNFLPPENTKPTLITHEDLLTLLHEFGHVLQHLLTKINYRGVSGNNGIPWDTIEIASQLMENWGWQKSSLKLLSCHHETKKPLPTDLLNKLAGSRQFHSALQLLRQVELSLLDLRIHLEADSISEAKLNDIAASVAKIAKITPRYKNASILNTFSHIFAGEYAAGYYSYKWAELLAADLFSRFKKEGIFNRKTGRALLKTILEKGGSISPLVLFKKFMGREPKIDSLLKQEGIL